MKKYMKCKFAEQVSANEAAKIKKDEQDKEKMPPPPMPPPLPPSPPPPIVPPTTKFKLEVIDEEYQDGPQMMTGMPQYQGHILPHAQQEGYAGQPMKEIKAEPTDPGKKEIMCRNFIRGKCTRGKLCIFTHAIILSQLDGVYKFCNDFQNSVCHYVKCKFVHATVSEKEYFYRSGYLPPHAVSHLKESSSNPPPPPLPPPPPPPPPPLPPPIPPPPPENTPKMVPYIYAGVPLAVYSGTPMGVPVVAYMQAPMDGGQYAVYDMYQSGPSTESSTPKRDYTESTESTVESPPAENNQPEPKKTKCHKCDLMEFRVQYIKNKVESMTRDTEELEMKMNLLDKKSNRLFNVLNLLLKPMKPTTTNTLPNTSTAREAALLEVLKLLLAARSRPKSPELIEEPRSPVSSSTNSSTLLAKLLLSSMNSPKNPK